MAYQNRIDPARLVFIDETWTKTNSVLVNKHLRRRFAGGRRADNGWRAKRHTAAGRP
jgi:hypothetical protein